MAGGGSPTRLRTRAKLRQRADSAELAPTIPEKSATVHFDKSEQEKLKKQYYEYQEELLQHYKEDDDLLAGRTEEKEDQGHMDFLLSRLTFGLNICLLFANLTAAILSGSLSIVGTFVDTFMDLSTGVIMNGCLYLIHHRTDVYEYPRGRDRLEMLGIIFCSVLMGCANIAIILKSVYAIQNDLVDPEMTLVTLMILVVGCSIKVVLMSYCFKHGSSSSTVLAIDMRNDIATNAVAVFCAFVGDRYWKYADPFGAILICGIISRNWFAMAFENIPFMIGRRTEKDNFSRILRIALEHDERIKKIDHIMIYHLGATAIVELHIVMDENLPLKVTHDIAHPLEKKINKLDFVERTFVHCDYNCDGD